MAKVLRARSEGLSRECPIGEAIHPFENLKPGVEFVSYFKPLKSWLASMVFVASLSLGSSAVAGEADSDKSPVPAAQPTAVAEAGVPASPQPQLAPVAVAPAAPSEPPAPLISKELAQQLAQSGFADAGPGGFSIRSADKAAQLRLHLQVQADGRFWKGTTPSGGKETFFLRRAIDLYHPETIFSEVSG